MGRVITKRFQTCDFCHKEYELSSERNARDILDFIELPGYAHHEDSNEWEKVLVGGSICSECEERLRQTLEPYLSLELRDLVVNVNGTTQGHSQIEWKEEKPE